MSTGMKVLIGCAAFLGLAVLAVTGIAIYAAKVVIPKAMQSAGQASQLPQPGVLQGKGVLSSRPFLQDPRLGAVTDIRTGKLTLDPRVTLGVAGSQGAAFVDAQGAVQSWVSFSSGGERVSFVDVEGDGVTEFLRRGSWSTPAALMDHQGKTLWTYGGSPGVDDAAGGDFNADGRLEFAVGFNGGGGVHLVDSQGKRLWKQSDANVWHVEAVDVDGDGTPEILHSNARGVMTIRDATGATVSTAQPPAYFSQFSLCPWPDRKSPLYPLFSEQNTIWLLDYSGSPRLQLNAPHCGNLGSAVGAPVKLDRSRPHYLAVAVAFRQAARSLLYVYDDQGSLLYQEVLAGQCGAVAALPQADGSEALLVGGEGEVLRYLPAGAGSP